MNAVKKVRRIKSISAELLNKSRESSLAGVQIFNNPQITFKSELFIVLMVIAWTYMLHAYYRQKNIDYRYFKLKKTKKYYDRTKSGAYKHWELQRCLDDEACPIDSDTKSNLKFLIGIRHEIEHQMTSKIDATLSAKFQACCLNFNNWIKKLFGNQYAIDRHLSFSLQFSAISRDQVEQLTDENLPPHIQGFISNFENQLSDEVYTSQAFAYRVLFVAKTVNHKGQADTVIEFVPSGTELAESVNKSYAVIKETEKPKLLPSEIVLQMKNEGFFKFKINDHAELWKLKDAKNPKKNFGVKVAKTWLWYNNWLNEVRIFCNENKNKFS